MDGKLEYSCSMDYLWVFMYTFTQVFMPCWNFEYTKAVTLHCVKVGVV